MCGVCGFAWPDEELITRTAALLSHRGPDHTGTFVDDNVSLGHTRLQVVDLSSAANQPMRDNSGSLYIVFNGEIYNYRELRAELEALGHSFDTESDTEVFLAAYKQWNVDAFNRFNGMWAASIYDREASTLVLTRDRVGKKPLYYTYFDSRLAFASELKALLPLLEKAAINRDAVDLLLSSQFVPSPMTMFEGIHKLEPRQYLRFHLASSTSDLAYYCEIPSYTPTYDYEKLVAAGKSLLEDAVRVRLKADVPLGAFLSGGVDSTAIVALTKKLAPSRPVDTISVGFAAPGADETPYAELASKTIGTRHNSIRFQDKDIEDTVSRAMWTYDDPVADPASLPLYVLCQKTRELMTVSLSGDGGDEIFGGYESRRLVAQMAALRRVPMSIRKILHYLLKTARGYRADKLGFLTEALRVSLRPPEEYFAELGASYVYRPPAFKKWATSRLKETLSKSRGDLVEAMLKFDIHFNRLGDNYCAKVDRMSMAHALEVRSPFLDYRMVLYASRIPAEWKLNTKKTKILMREILKDIVPEEILTRKKQGFGSPLNSWINNMDDHLREGLDCLHKEGVLRDQWLEFYKQKVFSSPHPMYREYKKRLYFLLRWHHHWHSGTYAVAQRSNNLPKDALGCP